jgi:hypothetical protein
MEEVLEQKKNKVHQLINTIDDEMELDFLVNAFQNMKLKSMEISGIV